MNLATRTKQSLNPSRRNTMLSSVEMDQGRAISSRLFASCLVTHIHKWVKKSDQLCFMYGSDEATSETS